MNNLETAIAERIEEIRTNLHEAMIERVQSMKSDTTEHHLMYQALGIPPDQAILIDLFQNIGRLLFRHAGAIAEDLIAMCFEHAYPGSCRQIRLNNPRGTPKRFEIDLLLPDGRALEVKWRDATTDGDHVRKECARVDVIHRAGYTPVRLMLFLPQRETARAIQDRLRALYENMGGVYLAGDEAWDYIRSETGVDLWDLLQQEVARAKVAGQELLQLT